MRPIFEIFINHISFMVLANDLNIKDSLSATSGVESTRRDAEGSINKILEEQKNNNTSITKICLYQSR